MSERTDNDLTLDILEVLKRIGNYTHLMTQAQFMGDLLTQDAVVRNLEIIGEAANRFSNEFREKHFQIPWKGIIGMRNRLIHHYFGVNLDIVWEIIQIELPLLEKKLKNSIIQ